MHLNAVNSVLSINLIAFFACAQAMSPDLKKQKNHTDIDDRQALQEVERRIFYARILTAEDMKKGKYYKSVTKQFSKEELEKIEAAREKIFKPIEITFKNNNTTTQ